MKSMNINPFIRLKEIANEEDFKVVLPSETTAYNRDKGVYNLRFEFKPAAIAYCKNEYHVSTCIKFCNESSQAFRIRSGSHHHEGMCSADGVLVIDLSEICEIEYLSEKLHAWIPSGIMLEEVYKQLASNFRIIPGGGCETVSTGGLTQGGGWGLSARKLGLTCDSIIEAVVVLADGRIVTTNNTNEPDLFWAIRGGGGGNFGVVIKFLFKLYPISVPPITCELHWSNADMLNIVNAWIAFLPKSDHDLTTVCKLSVVKNEHLDNSAITLTGQFYGTVEDLKSVLKPFYDIAKPVCEKYNTLFPNTHAKIINTCAESTPEIHCSPNNNKPQSTCTGPLPHKVSSTFPIDSKSTTIAEKICHYIQNSKEYNNVATYVSLMSFGGVVKNKDNSETAFPYREKEFVIQFQAWWKDKNDPLGKEYIKWIEDFRSSLKGEVEGAFINFPDKSIVNDSNTPEGKDELMALYYGENYKKLKKIKSSYDPLNRFNFEMSIPLEIN